jgi:hypothetical protein
MEQPDPGQCVQPYGPEYSADGVDLTVIRWMLSMSPLERLNVLQNHMDSIMELRGAIKTYSQSA